MRNVLCGIWAWARARPIWPVMVLALGLRLYGINWDQGYRLHVDEFNVTRWTMLMIDKARFEHTLDVGISCYGALPFYIRAILYAPLMVANHALGGPLEYGVICTYVGRFVSAAADVAIVYLVYLIALELWGLRAALLAAGLCGTTALAVRESHFGTVDTQASLLMWMSLAWWIGYLEKRPLKAIVGFGVLLGLSISVKMSTAALAAAPVFILVWLAWHRSLRPKGLTGLACLTVGIPTVVFLLLNPYAWLHGCSYWAVHGPGSLTWNLQAASGGRPLPWFLVQFAGVSRTYPLLHVLPFAMGPVYLAGCLASLPFAFWAWGRSPEVKHKGLAVAGAILLLSACWPRLYMTRYFLPLMPFAALVTAWSLDRLLGITKRNWRLLPVGAVLAGTAGWCLSLSVSLSGA